MGDVDFRATTTAVLQDLNHNFTDMIVKLLEQRNKVVTTPDGRKTTCATVSKGYGLLVMVDSGDDEEPFTITTEFLVPSNELAASFMVMWRRWCDKRVIDSKHGLLRVMNRVVDDMNKHVAEGNHQTISNLAIGLMGGVLDNYPEIVDSMQWSVDSGFVPCLVIANDNDSARCAVCYGGKYDTDEVSLN